MSGSAPTVALPDENVFGHRKKLEFLRRRVMEYVNRRPDRRIRLLDIGCSNGQLVTIHLGDLGVDIVAIDPHEPSIEYARAHNPYPHIITFQKATIEDLSPDERFDIIVMADVLEHLENPGDLLREARRRLDEGGLILASIPNGYGPFEIENALDKRGCLAPSYWIFRMLSRLKPIFSGGKRAIYNLAETPYAFECGHVQFWTLNRFKKLAEKCGMRIVERRNGPWMGALCTSTWWGRSRRFCAWNARIGDLLPSFMVSTWYFVIEKCELAK